ncbi:Hypothetical predicted protein [Cloeon dipterum]|uniref:Tetraspanin n=1 Tax=Cloeon dipterum TaxID=197152 RepID=A0A8S1CZP0_9INSE|nr:Hypothetical predicted protein [Cloeon dipterum]
MSSKNLPVLKILTLLFCISTLVLGVVLIGVSANALRDPNIKELNGVKAIMVVLIVTGSLIAVGSIFGCCGIFADNYAVLNIFVCLSMVACATLAVLGIVIFVRKSTWTEQVEKNAIKYFGEYQRAISFLDNYPYGNKDNISENALKFVDLVQKHFECCGWAENSGNSQKFTAVEHPESCACLGPTKNCKQQYFIKLCSANFKNDVSAVIVNLGTMAMACGICLLITGCISCGVAKKQKDYDNLS